MKNVRIWFKKDYECRYISHLDLNRCMLRALHKSKIPVWHTEGFNPHPFATFPLPLSLGFRGLRVFNVTEPVMKPGKIAYAEFTIRIGDKKTSSHTICEQLNELLLLESIMIEKKSKKGMKTIDIKEGIKLYTVSEHFDYAQLDITLSAGSADNVNPNLIISAFNTRFGADYDIDITRNDLYDSEMQLFR